MFGPSDAHDPDFRPNAQDALVVQSPGVDANYSVENRAIGVPFTVTGERRHQHLSALRGKSDSITSAFRHD